MLLTHRLPSFLRSKVFLLVGFSKISKYQQKILSKQQKTLCWTLQIRSRLAPLHIKSYVQLGLSLFTLPPQPGGKSVTYDKQKYGWDSERDILLFLPDETWIAASEKFKERFTSRNPWHASVINWDTFFYRLLSKMNDVVLANGDFST